LIQNEWNEIMTDSHGAILPAFTEHRVRHAGGSLYVRDFPGSGPAFVLLHGFPDNSYIYDHLIPHLAGAGRRTMAFDFLGFGASDKPEGAVYTFEQQLGDLARSPGSHMNLAEWLKGLGLGQYADAFAENDIDFSLLEDLLQPRLSQ
jgi:pimeloyl-ACP methyl ester carboxylesterase